MRFTVTFTPTCEQDLAAAWLAAADRRAVTAAASRIEHLLAADPLAVGEGRESSVNRVAMAPPLGFSFDVVVDDSRVFVTGVWLVS